MDPLISVVLPTFNHAHLIGDAILSVCNQTYKNFELIIVDNHSEDNTDEVIRKFKDKRIRTIKTKNNGVIAVSRNIGMRSAQGEWIAFIDSDDIWYHDKLSETLKNINSHYEIDVFCHDEIIVKSGVNKRKVLTNGPWSDNFYYKMLIEGNKLSTSCTIVSSKWILSNNLYFREDRDLIAVEDYDFWLRIAKNGGKFHFFKNILGEYRVHGGNMSMVTEKYFDNLSFLIKDHVTTLPFPETENEQILSLLIIKISISKSIILFQNRKYGQFIILLFRKILSSPYAIGRLILIKFFPII